MSDRQTPVLFTVLNKAEDKDGYTEHFGLNADLKARPKASCVTGHSVDGSSSQVTPTAVVTSKGAVPSTTSPSTEMMTASRKRTLLNIARKPLRGNGTGILINTQESTPSKRSESVIVNNRSLRSPPTVPKRRFSTPSSNTPASAATTRQGLNNSLVTTMKTVLLASSPMPSSTGSVDRQNSITPTANIKYAICRYCGAMSENFNVCGRCHRSLDKPKEYEPTVLKMTPAITKDAEKKLPNCSISSLSPSFYSHHKFGDTNWPFAGRPKIPLTLQKFSSKAKKTKAAPRIEPPILILSSDDEGLDGNDEENANENGWTSNPRLEDVNNAISVTGSSNDEIQGNQAALKSLALPSVMLTSSTMSMRCRLRVGSYKVAPKDPVFVSSNKFSLKVPSVCNQNDIVMVTIDVTDIVSVMTYFGDDFPALFLYLTPKCAAFIRSRLRMSNKAGPFFDPSCDDDIMKRLIMLPETLDETQRTYLNKMFTDASAGRNIGDTFHDCITKGVANELLIRSSAQEAKDDLNLMCKRSTATLQVAKKQQPMRSPVIRHSLRLQTQRHEYTTLATYPRPPAVGGITVTSDDIRCLVPGEFLNDVIIDFYLKYLFYEKLSADDRERTHIFSSFFYKRLTNSDMPSETDTGKDLVKTNGNKALSIAESRHSRVKNWTRNVNIFTKDFIIIPINENSHWFLVLICFAHLVGLVGDEESCPPPSAEHDYESDMIDAYLYGNDSQTDTNVESSNKSTTSEQIKSEVKEESGVSKRPCILIFDSLRTHSSWSHVFRQLREYLAIEYQHKMHSKREFSKETIRASYPIVPQQTNYSDCGIFVLQYVESFFKDPIKNFQQPIRGVDTWFSSDVVCKNKRKEIEELILRLQQEQAEQCKSGNGKS